MGEAKNPFICLIKALFDYLINDLTRFFSAPSLKRDVFDKLF